jgi:hypothetical protein
VIRKSNHVDLIRSGMKVDSGRWNDINSLNKEEILIKKKLEGRSK